MGLVGMALGAMYCARPVRAAAAAGVREAARRSGCARSPGIAARSASRRTSRTTCACAASRIAISRAWISRRWRVAGCGAEPIHAPTLAAFAEKFAAGRVPRHQLSAQLRSGRARARRDVSAARPARRGSSTSRPTTLTERRVAIRVAGDDDPRSRWSAAARALPGHRIRIVGRRRARAAANAQVGEICSGRPVGDAGLLQATTTLTGADDPRRLAAHRRSRLSVGRRAVRLRPGERHHHRQRPEVSPAGSRVGRSTISPACAAAAWSRSERPRAARADRVVIVVEPSGTVAATRSRDAIRRRIGDLFGLYVDEVVARAERHGRPDDQRQGAARGDQGALRAWRSPDGDSGRPG